ncbi:Uncharacterized protein SCF082_LOCUS38833, partial [Durusdinium trenchii]
MSCGCRLARTMFRCCSAAFHAIYSILRNGLWDDPAEAVTGAVYKEFSKQVEAKGIHPNAAVYLTWRYCYLKCFILIGVVWAVSSWSSWLPDRAFLDNFVRNLPEEIQANRFETFIVVMSWWDPALILVWLSSFLVVLCSIFLAAPSRVLKYKNSHLSRYLVWGAWLWNFALPFAALLLFPIRFTIDWAGVQEDLCVVAVARSMNSAGTDLNSAVEQLQQQKLLAHNVQSLLVSQEEQRQVTEVSARAWCQEQGQDWFQVFCQEIMECVVTVDQRCRAEVCPSAPDEELRDCLGQCLEYAQRGSVGQQFMESLSQCGSLPSHLKAPRGNFSNALQNISQCGGSIDLEVLQLMQLQQELNYKDQCTYSSLAVDRVEFVAGAFVGINAGMLLLPSALSILGGLAESIFNLKVLLPGHQEFPFLLLLTSFEALPIYAALLAVVQQSLGDSVLFVACLAFICYVGLPALTGCLTRHLRPGPEHRWLFYRRVWLEYSLRAALVLVMFISFGNYLRNLVGERFVQDHPVRLLLLTTLSYFTRKSLTAVASTDAAVSAFLQCEHWRRSFAAEDRKANE